MHYKKSPSGASFQWAHLGCVVIERSSLPNWEELTRRWPAPDGFLVLPCPGTVDQVLAECRRVAPCVLVISEEAFEKLNADEFTSSVTVGGSIQVLVLGGHKSPDQVAELLCMGCMGYLFHDDPRPRLWKAVRAVACGEVWAERKTVSLAINKLILKQSMQDLTAQERAILRLIACGFPNRVIADRLYITHETVRWHIRSLYSKIGVHDRLGAVVYGSRLLDSERRGAPAEIADTLRTKSSGGALQKHVSPMAAGGDAALSNHNRG